MFESWQLTTPGMVECIEGDLFAGSPADRTNLFVDCLAGTNAAIHIAEAKTKEEAAGYSNEKIKGIIGNLKYPTIREVIPGMTEWFARTHA